MATAVLHCFVSFLSSEVKNPGLFIYAGEICKLIQRNKFFYFFIFRLFSMFLLLFGPPGFIVLLLLDFSALAAPLLNTKGSSLKYQDASVQRKSFKFHLIL